MLKEFLKLSSVEKLVAIFTALLMAAFSFAILMSFF